MSKGKPTLIVHAVYFPVAVPPRSVLDDPERRDAIRYGEALYELLTRRLDDRLSWGAGIPVRIGTHYEHVDKDEAEHVVVVPVLGALSQELESVRKTAIKTIRQWVADGLHVMPVLTSTAWRAHENKNELSLKLLFHPSKERNVDEIVLALARVLAKDDAYATRLFISHAKADLEVTARAAETIRDQVQQFSTGDKPFFDTVSLLPGEELESQIDGDASRGIFIAVRTDTYSSRAWCLRELLKAKRNWLPVVTVEILRSGERRSIPYAGNAPTVVWRSGIEQAEIDRVPDPEERKRLEALKKQVERESAARVVRAAIVEQVRKLFFEAEGPRLVDAALQGDSVLIKARPPELLDLPAIRAATEGIVVVLHPDPELVVHERAVLLDADKRIRTVTPTTAFAGGTGGGLRAPLYNWQVALSISDQPRVSNLDGIQDAHVHDATVFLARMLLGAGAALAYGGDFRDLGYTALLTQLVGAYNQTAATPADLLHSYTAAPMKRPDTWTQAYTAHHLGPFGVLEAQAKLPPPPEGAWPAAHRAALYFSDMRRLMAKYTHARVLVSGSIIPKGDVAQVDAANDPKGYTGRLPGVVEEAWRTMEAGCPLYVAGGFGGGAAVVAELLQSKDTEEPPYELRETSWGANKRWTELAAAMDSDTESQNDIKELGAPSTQEDLARRIRALAPRLDDDTASIAWNGLSGDENRTLFRTKDPLTIATLVLKGLLTVAATRARAEGKRRIELVEGDVTSASDLDVLVFPTFTDLDPSGAAIAIDSVSGDAATRAHRTRRPVPTHSKTFAVEYVYAADLGDMATALKQPAASVVKATRATAAMAMRHRFARIGIVTFLGNVAENLGDVVSAMLEGLAGLPENTHLVWFESDPARAAMLATLLAGKNVEVTRIVASPSASKELPSGKSRTMVQIRRTDDNFDVVLLVPHANGLAPALTATADAPTRAALAGDMREVAPAEPELGSRGAKIAQMMFGNDPSVVLQAVGESEIAILHDASGSALPYEALSWDVDGKRLTPATQGGIVRHLVAKVDADRGLVGPPRKGTLRVLVVIDPKKDLKKAAEEGEMIVALLKKDPRVEVDALRGDAATVDAILARLDDPQLDMVHYCGHAFYQGAEPHQSGLKCADGDLTITHLRGLSRVPRLVVFNACQAARVRGDFDAAVPETFAEFFLHAGVEAYLGTFWLVTDDGAKIFADELYATLARGGQLGEAVIRGRKRLFDAGNSDWANYMLYGRSDFRLVRAGEAATAPSGPSSWGRAEGKKLVGSWSFPASDAPSTFAVSVTERIGNGELPAETDGAMRVDRRDGWSAGSPTVQWVVSVTLEEAADGRGFRLRASEGAPVDIGTPRAAPATRAARMWADELEDLKKLLDQQPDGGKAILARLMPSADPDELRKEIAEAVADPKALRARATWPFHVFAKPKADDNALAEFFKVYPKAKADRDEVVDQRFQTKEDWVRYATASGAPSFHIGAEVSPPLSLDLPTDPQRRATEMTYRLRPDEGNDGSISVALFADNGNGTHAAKAIAAQIVASELPYAFHLGDVYYGGNKDEFKKYFEDPLKGMFEKTELFMITGNHEMYAGGEWFNDLIRRKKIDHDKRQRQRHETFRLLGDGFQIIGLDTMFVGWNAGQMRLHDYADSAALEVLDVWLNERPDDLTVLLTTNEPWDRGSIDLKRLYRSLRKTIAGRVDLWFWGNVHYAALFEPWTFADSGMPTRQLVGSCIGHGGYPFYTDKAVGMLPPGVSCRWLETKSRFWPEERVRPDVGLNGWCRMKLARQDKKWNVGLTYKDWVGRDRLHVDLVRNDGESIKFTRVEESEQSTVDGPVTWNALGFEAAQKKP